MGKCTASGYHSPSNENTHGIKVKVGFSILNWAAWAPGLADQAAWQRWLAQPQALVGEEKPALPEMPPMARRRIDRLGRMALQVAYWCQTETGSPIIFASQHGDTIRSAELLQALARGEPISPAGFSVSVHNAIGAQYSIARRDASNYLAVAAGPATVEAAFCEAAGLLADGHQTVLVVVYDEPLPEVYHNYADPQALPFAWACQLAAGHTIELDNNPARQTTTESALPHPLAILRLLVLGGAPLQAHWGAAHWQWSHHD